MSKFVFEDALAQYVLEKLVKDIDAGTTLTIDTSYYDNAGQLVKNTMQVNVQDVLISKVVQRLTGQDNKIVEKVKVSLEKIIASDSFRKRLAKEASESLIKWLDSPSSSSWYDDKKFPNRETFKKDVRAAMVKIVAQKKAEDFMSEELNRE